MVSEEKIGGDIPLSLRWRFALTIILNLGFTLALYAWLMGRMEGSSRWMVTTLLVICGQSLFLYFHLSENRDPISGEMRPTFGWGNGLTLTRGLFLAWMAGFLFIPQPQGGVGWLPMACYTVAALIDFFDGLVARLTHHVTLLGETLDLEFDALGIGTVVLLVILWGLLGWWFLLPALARYLFIGGLWWRERHGRPNFAMTDSRYRRLIAGYNMGFLTVMLWPIMSANGALLGAAIFLPPFLMIFWRDWLVVSGRLDPNNARYQKWHDRLVEWGAQWLPVFARVVIALTIWSTGLITFTTFGHPFYRELLGGWGWPEPWLTDVSLGLTWLGLVLLLLVVMGVWARWLALAALFPATLLFLGGGSSFAFMDWDLVLLVAGVCIVVILNSGRYSLFLHEPHVYQPYGPVLGDG